MVLECWKNPEHKKAKSGYCRKNSRIKCNHQTDWNCETLVTVFKIHCVVGGRGSLGKAISEAGPQCLLPTLDVSKRMLIVVCFAGYVSGETMQRVINQSHTGAMALRPVTRQPVSPLLCFLQCAALKISSVKLQKCIFVNEVFTRKCYFSCIKLLCRQLKSVSACQAICAP